LLRAADALGWVFDDSLALRKKQGLPVQEEEKPTFSAPDAEKESEPYFGRLLVEGEQVAFRIEERFRDEPVEPTAAQLARDKREYGYYAPRRVAVASGALRVIRFDAYRTWGTPDRRSWYDWQGRRVEDQTSEVLLGLYELAVSIRERRAKDEQEAREGEERARAVKRSGRHARTPTKSSSRSLSGMPAPRNMRATCAGTSRRHGSILLASRFGSSSKRRPSISSSGRKGTWTNWTPCTRLRARWNSRKAPVITTRMTWTA
jgi:hypothetical protein